MAVATVFPTLSTACVALRFKIRTGPDQEIKSDDWMALISLVSPSLTYGVFGL